MIVLSTLSTHFSGFHMTLCGFFSKNRNGFPVFLDNRAGNCEISELNGQSPDIGTFVESATFVDIGTCVESV